MELPVLFVSDGVIFPHAQIKLPIRSKANFFMIESCLMEKNPYTIVAIVYGTDRQSIDNKFFPVCTIAAVEKVVCLSTNATSQYTLHVRGVARGELLKQALPLSRVKQLYDPETPMPEASVASDFLAHLMVLLSFAPSNSTRDSLRRMLANKDKDLNKIVYLTMSLLRMVSYDEQLAFLAEQDGAKRLRTVMQYAREAIKAYGSVNPKHELELPEAGQLAAGLKMAPSPRSRPPRRRLSEVEQLKQDLSQCGLPEGVVRDAIMEDFHRLASMPNGSQDYQVLFGYLKFVAALPWNKTTEDSCDLQKSREILDHDHEGMLDVKKRVMEFLAVKQMKNDMKGPILCLLGPPGVGKTSIAKAIADTLGRNFQRISLGGIRDQSDIRGHRRTYVGAMAGRVMQAIKQAKSRNPVILLDEVDKMGVGPQGDPSAALLEVLDPAQNHTFQDLYLNVPFDLSQVLFIATANDAATIPAPLLDRMELIEMSGYTSEQKVEIARKYIIPRQLAAHSMVPDYLRIQPDALHRIVSRYTRESGVRQLERQIAAVCRWAALRLAEAVNGGVVELDTTSGAFDLPIRVRAADLETILGRERFVRSRALLRHAARNVGVSLGLAWTPFGGEVLVVETVLSKGTGKVNLTGKLGEVIKESVQVAISLLKSRADKYGLDFAQLQDSDLHVHMPAGAVAKDGPSAGCAFTLALFSLLSGKKVRSDSACTGEISLTGKVLPVGGVKEKVLAAHRAGILRVSLPTENQRDVADLDASIVEKMDIFFVDTADQLIDKMICTTDADSAKL